MQPMQIVPGVDVGREACHYLHWLVPSEQIASGNSLNQEEVCDCLD